MVRRRAHAHLAQIDLLTLMSAFGSAPVEEEQHLVDLSRELLAGSTTRYWRSTHRSDRIQHAALRAGDVELLRRLAVLPQRRWTPWRCTCRSPARGGPWQLDYNYPGLREDVVPQELYRLSEAALTLRRACAR